MTGLWSQEQEAFILANPADYAGFNARWPMHYERWRGKRRRLVAREQFPVEMSGIGGPAHATQTLVDPPTPDDWESYFTTLIEADEQSRYLGSSQDTTEWTPLIPGPVAIAFTGDWHCGAKGVEYGKLNETLDTIRETDGLYAVGMGDYAEGVSIHSKAAPALYTGLFNSGDEQERYVKMRFDRAWGKWIAIISGNHDEWLYKHAGLTRMSRIAADLEIPHFGEGGGTIYANVGDARYAIGVRHNAPGNSRLNTTNSQRRMFDDWPQWDNLHVAVIAHLHHNDLHIASRKGQRCVYLRSGTNKVHDAYAKAGGFTPEWGVPLVILYPDRLPVAFRGDDFDLGLQFFKNERDRYLSTK